ncbi:hypothetical protein V8E55_011912 [Tylopilus felleus]
MDAHRSAREYIILNAPPSSHGSERHAAPCDPPRRATHLLRLGRRVSPKVGKMQHVPGCATRPTTRPSNEASIATLALLQENHTSSTFGFSSRTSHPSAAVTWQRRTSSRRSKPIVEKQAICLWRLNVNLLNLRVWMIYTPMIPSRDQMTRTTLFRSILLPSGSTVTCVRKTLTDPTSQLQPGYRTQRSGGSHVLGKCARQFV